MSDTTDTGLLVISGYNIRAVVALCRWASNHNMVPHIVARNADDPIYLTAYKQHVILERNNPTLGAADFCQWLRNLKEKYDYASVFIAPSSEFLNRFLLEHRGAIASAGGIVPLVSKKLYESVSDKYAFREMCESYAIPAPKFFDVAPSEFPFVAKPKTYASSSGRQLKPHLIFNKDDWQAFKRSEDENDYYFEEYVDGRSLYLLAHISKSGEATTYAQENLIQQAKGGSIVLARYDEFYLTEAAEDYLRMLRNVGFHGLIMIEVRSSLKQKKYVMIEANPRMWGPIQFVVDNNVDMIGELMRDYRVYVEPLSVEPLSQRYYFWSGGLSWAQQPFAFHNYSSAKFLQDYKKLVRADIFNRPDTQELFQHELAE